MYDVSGQSDRFVFQRANRRITFLYGANFAAPSTGIPYRHPSFGCGIFFGSTQTQLPDHRRFSETDDGRIVPDIVSRGDLPLCPPHGVTCCSIQRSSSRIAWAFQILHPSDHSKCRKRSKGRDFPSDTGYDSPQGFSFHLGDCPQNTVPAPYPKAPASPLLKLILFLYASVFLPPFPISPKSQLSLIKISSVIPQAVGKQTIFQRVCFPAAVRVSTTPPTSDTKYSSPPSPPPSRHPDTGVYSARSGRSVCGSPPPSQNPVR